jgi:hypothetical protein
MNKVAMCLGLTIVKKEFHLFQGIMFYILGDDCCNVLYVLEFLNAIGVVDFMHVIIEIPFLGSMFLFWYRGEGCQVPHQPVILVLILFYQYTGVMISL